MDVIQRVLSWLCSDINCSFCSRSFFAQASVSYSRFSMQYDSIPYFNLMMSQSFYLPDYVMLSISFFYSLTVIYKTAFYLFNSLTYSCILSRESFSSLVTLLKHSLKNLNCPVLAFTGAPVKQWTVEPDYKKLLKTLLINSRYSFC